MNVLCNFKMGCHYTTPLHTISFRFKILIAILLIGLLPITARGEGEIGSEFIAPGHWVYAALERFETLGLCSIPLEGPFLRKDIVVLIKEIEDSIQERSYFLSPRDRFNLARLRKEFSSVSSQSHPKSRYDPPLVFQSDPPVFLEGDMDFIFRPGKPPFNKKTEVFLEGHPEGKIHYGSAFTYDFRYRLILGPERNKRARNEKPSPREKSFKGLTSLFERSYFVIHKRNIAFFLGRKYADWGPSPEGNLLVSSTTGSLDQLGVRLKIGRLSLSLIHAALSLEKKRYFAAHRAEFRWRSFLLGISESVIYAGRDWDPVYSFPLSSFYANQFNEKGDDNILWGVDFKVRPRGTVLLYGSLLIDDFQFERDGTAPDKIGFDLGIRYARSRPFALSLHVLYRYLDIYTYTHRDTFTAYLGGRASLSRGDPVLGAGEGPDSDHWLGELTFYPRSDISLGLGGSVLRRGEGNDFRPYNSEDQIGIDPPFPYGIVERTTDLSVFLNWELARGSSIVSRVTWENVKNKEHVSGRDDSGTAFMLSIAWDF